MVKKNDRLGYEVHLDAAELGTWIAWRRNSTDGKRHSSLSISIDSLVDIT